MGGRLRSKRFPDAGGTSRPVDTLDIGGAHSPDNNCEWDTGTLLGLRRVGFRQRASEFDSIIFVSSLSSRALREKGSDRLTLLLLLLPANRLFCAEDIYSSVSVWSFVRSSSLGKSRARAFPSEEGFLPLTVSIQSGATILNRGWVWGIVSTLCFNSSFWEAWLTVHAT